MKGKKILETVNGFGFRRFWGLFWPIFDSFFGVNIRKMILTPKKESKSWLKRTPKSTETKSVNSLLVISTLAIFCTLFFIAVMEHRCHESLSLVTRGRGFPAFGRAEAPIEIVLIEDFRCPHCKVLNHTILSKLQETYIREGKARLTLVPLSFLDGSLDIANAALEVYRQNPAEFLSYLAGVEGDLIEPAKEREGIDVEKLRRCIEQGCHNEELARNFEWARKVMGVAFRTPALYINGAVGSTYSFEAIQYQIEEILRQ